MVAPACLSSARDDWRTPAGILEVVRKVGPIVLDPCSCEGSIVEAREEWRQDRGDDALDGRSWRRDPAGVAFVNPPYGAQIFAFIDRCWRAWNREGQPVIALVPARTDARWFQLADAEGGVLLLGRLTFLGAVHPAPFPSALLYFGGRAPAFFAAAGELGMPIHWPYRT